jgi:hypothetical protein
MRGRRSAGADTFAGYRLAGWPHIVTLWSRNRLIIPRKCRGPATVRAMPGPRRLSW